MGPGGIGGVIGARLFATGKDVALVARGSHLEALQRSGLRLVTPDAVEHYQIPTFGRVSELSLSSDLPMSLLGQGRQWLTDVIRRFHVGELRIVMKQRGGAQWPQY
jgi:hypothetical protein